MAKGYWLSVTNFSSETYQHQMPEACKRGSAVAGHVWENHHPIHWEETTVLEDRSCWWRRPSTSRWHPWRSASTEMEDWKSLVAGPLMRPRAAIFTNLCPPMTCMLSSGVLSGWDGKENLETPKVQCSECDGGWSTIKAKILVRNMGFLLRLMSADEHSLSARTLQSSNVRWHGIIMLS